MRMTRKGLQRRAHIAFSAALGLAACELPSAQSYEPQPVSITTGGEGLLPAVSDLRRSSCDRNTDLSFTLRFTRPMNRGNVEAGLAFYEVMGDAVGYDVPLNRESPVEPQPGSFRWEDGNRLVSFSVALPDHTQYVLQLPETVTDELGRGLDGLVGADIDGDGIVDISRDEHQYARVDNDFIAKPVPFLSLPVFACDDRFSPAIWRTPLNNARPRVLELIGVMPNNENPPRYLPGTGSDVYSYAVTDGDYRVTLPLPAKGVLRMRVAAPNTAPTHGFGQRWGSIPVAPSRLVNAFDVFDENERSFNGRLFLDNRLRIPAPLVGTAGSATATILTADALKGIPDGSLTGAWLVALSSNGYRYSLPIVDNNGTAGTVTVSEIYFTDPAAGGAEDAQPDKFKALVFHNGAFRPNELVGLKITTSGVWDEVLTVGSNRGQQVNIETGVINCAAYWKAKTCDYSVHVDLVKMGLENAPFEIVPEHVYITTDRRPDGQVYSVRLNIGEELIVDEHGFPLVDGREDGNEQTGEADDRWSGLVPGGDISTMPIPPTLQLNDGRWYQLTPEPPTPGQTVSFMPYGTFTHLSHGIYARSVTRCEAGKPVSRYEELGLVFATPDGTTGAIGRDELLDAASVNDSNLSIVRLENGEPHALAAAVTGVTIQLDLFRNGAHYDRQPTTLVLVSPPSTDRTAVKPGADGICGTSDDLRAQAYREWEAGDRLLISHRLRHPTGDQNTLDGNYDAILSFDHRDDMLFEYDGRGSFRPLSTW